MIENYKDSKGDFFVKQKILVSKKTKQFAFQKNRFHTSECDQSNPNKMRRQSIPACCIEGVKSILETAKSLGLNHIDTVTLKPALSKPCSIPANEKHSFKCQWDIYHKCNLCLQMLTLTDI